MTVFIVVDDDIHEYQPNLKKLDRQYGIMDDYIAAHLPLVRIYQRSDKELRRIYTRIDAGNSVNAGDYPTALASLLKKFVIDNCTEAFSSCGHQICAAGQNMTPLNFLKMGSIELAEGQTEIPGVDEATEMVDLDKQKTLMAKMLAVYRMVNAKEIAPVGDPQNDYVARVMKQIAQACRKAGLEVGTVSLVNQEKFCNTVDYMRLLSAADMFFIRHQSHPLSCLRVGTLVMSYKDMSQANNTAYMKSLTSQTWDNMVYYTFETGVVREVAGIKGGAFWDQLYFFPYQSAMHLLGDKYTYYSNTRSPYFHNVVQILGMMNGSTRSFNAYYIETPTALNTAQAVIYQLAGTGEGGFIEAIFDTRSEATASKAVKPKRPKTAPLRAAQFYAHMPDKIDKMEEVAIRMLSVAKQMALQGSPRQRSFSEWLRYTDVKSHCGAFADMLRKQFPKPKTDDEDDDEDDDDGSEYGDPKAKEK